jgi:hypothetical protein
MDEAQLVHRYLHQQFHELLGTLHVIFDRQPALAVRMIRSEVELYENLMRGLFDEEEDGGQCSLEEMERLLSEDRD